MLATNEREGRTIGRDAESPIADADIGMSQLTAIEVVQKQLKQGEMTIAFSVLNDKRFSVGPPAYQSAPRAYLPFRTSCRRHDKDTLTCANKRDFLAARRPGRRTFAEFRC